MDVHEKRQKRLSRNEQTRRANRKRLRELARKPRMTGFMTGYVLGPSGTLA